MRKCAVQCTHVQMDVNMCCTNACTHESLVPELVINTKGISFVWMCVWLTSTLWLGGWLLWNFVVHTRPHKCLLICQSGCEKHSLRLKNRKKRQLGRWDFREKSGCNTIVCCNAEFQISWRLSFVQIRYWMTCLFFMNMLIALETALVVYYLIRLILSILCLILFNYITDVFLLLLV